MECKFHVGALWHDDARFSAEILVFAVDIFRKRQFCLVIKHCWVGSDDEVYHLATIITTFYVKFLVLVNILENETEVVGIQAVHHANCRDVS